MIFNNICLVLVGWTRREGITEIRPFLFFFFITLVQVRFLISSLPAAHASPIIEELVLKSASVHSAALGGLKSKFGVVNVEPNGAMESRRHQ